MQKNQLSLPSNKELIKRLRNWDADYVVRETERIKAHGEVFTPTALVKEVIGKLAIKQFEDPTKTFLDNSCGNGQFLSEVLIKKLEQGHDFKLALSTIHGVDIMTDNVLICQNRLLCGIEELRHIVEKNIVCADALTYDYSFK